MAKWARANLVEGVCLVLMVVLCVDVFLGVFSRYVLARTFTWYDEIARACFVWIVFVGAAVGIKHHTHFRLNLAVDRLSAGRRHVVELCGFGVVVTFAMLMIQQGWKLMELGRFQLTPVMGLSKFWIYLALPVSGVLMIVYALPLAARAVAALRHRSTAVPVPRPKGH